MTATADAEPTTPLTPPVPAFGQADLSNCELEQIHLAGSIQPHGVLIVLSPTDHIVVQASANASEFLHTEDPLTGQALALLAPDLFARLKPHLSEALDTVPVALHCEIGDPQVACDALVHRAPDGNLVVELERAGPPVDFSQQIETALKIIVAATSLKGLCDETARLFREIAGYHRVMVYRFDEEGHGEVFSEEREPYLEPYLGNRYPRSDIPQIARRLYERNRIRLLVDVTYEPVPLTPEPLGSPALDMSLCTLRSMSPIHLQYLRNMGVAATLVASIVVAGKLWGLVACHHYGPRRVPYGTRVVCELLAETVATRIAALEGFAQTQAELSVRRIEQRMIDAVSREGDWQSALFDNPQTLLQPLDAMGAALLIDDKILITGDVPGTQQLRAIAAWLDEQPRVQVFSSASLPSSDPRFTPLLPTICGLLAVSVSRSPGEYLMWFRPERLRTLVWGGNPAKPAEPSDDPTRLSPRRSFAQWQELVRGTSDPWTNADLTAARLVGGAVMDVVLQFRSVRMLIAQNQLAQVRRRVAVSEHPVIIADSDGRVLLANDALLRLIPAGEPPPGCLEDFTRHLADPATGAKSFRALIQQRRSWRGEVDLRTADGRGTPFLVRGDPVFASAENVLGFVVLLNDLTERRAAEAARRRFQESIVRKRCDGATWLDSSADLVYRSLLSSAVGNAQLAALEITDSVDTTRMPDMLDSVSQSLARTDQLLQFLLRHAATRHAP